MDIAKPSLDIIASQSAIIFPGIKARIYIPKKYNTTITRLLDSPGKFILAYPKEDEENTAYSTASLVCIEDFNLQSSGVWELIIKAYERIHLLAHVNPMDLPLTTQDYQIINYVDEEFILQEEEIEIKKALQVKIKKNFPKMPHELYSELMENFSISKFLHYLCFSSPKSKDAKIELLQYNSLYELYQKLIDGFMK
ncbi:hypothetical protein LNTAR_15802 [Lentisphaera araneosa HTCC2155]|jgi:ATP-dependent Lon protease|uniref:Lon N-terminal domain-containing protein n=1 Tax=Lentisphaera araneosa HTCC2155 TaxID=313628 RepID=A6DMF8_9BACT|nr:LON peptidase substrate-binding domain-containing protein [Lentisphaera araneosa]EDM27148.1 hypothetical protein LNTAR_15802 [Lentisphaera araneosa HTCC2155]